MINSLKCSCPLIERGCEKHLDACGYVRESCKLKCGVVLRREELGIYGYQQFKSLQLDEHYKECPNMEHSGTPSGKLQYFDFVLNYPNLCSFDRGMFNLLICFELYTSIIVSKNNRNPNKRWQLVFSNGFIFKFYHNCYFDNNLALSANKSCT